MTFYSARLGVVLAACVTRGTLGAQPCSSTPTSPSRTEWLPRGISRSEASPPSAADRATIAATLTAVEALVRNTVLATPRGYEIQPWWVYDAPVNRSRLSQYYVRIGLFCPTKASGTEPAPTLEITFNPDPIR